MSDNIVNVGVDIDGISGSFSPSAVKVREVIHGLRSIEVSLPGLPADPITSILKKGAQVSVTVDGTLVRRFEGVILKVRQNWTVQGAAVSLTIGSPLDFLALSTDCRIFQNQAMPDIVTTILTDAGIPADKIRKRLSGTYASLASCTQYNETMLAFVSRLLEQNGAYYYFEDDPDEGLGIVLGDSADAHKPQQVALLPFTADRGSARGAFVTAISELASTRPTKVTLSDLDWTNPTLALTASSAEKTLPTALEHYDHPGGHVTASDGTARANLILDAFVAAATGVSGTGTTASLAAGSTFTLSDAPRDDLNVEYVVTEATHEWSSTANVLEGWTTEFKALPTTIPFRPLRKTPKPIIRGPQTAFVTGPSGAEINTEANGQVHVKFHWDRRSTGDDKSSAWVRVAQENMGGAVAVPRIGWEVLVEFEHGDPDRPVVVGRLYNAMYVPPYALPDNKTRSSLMSYSSTGGAGHNEIRIEDLKGSEHIHMHAQKDHVLTVANDRTTAITTSRMVTIKADEQVTVKGNRTFTVKGQWETTVAGAQKLTVEGTRAKTVKTDEHITINGDRSTSITKSHAITTDANATIGAEGDVSASITGNLSEESKDEDASIVVGDDMSLTVGAAMTETVKKGKTATTEGKRTITVGTSLTDVSGGDFGLMVGGKRSSTIGAAWTMTSQGNVLLSSDGDMTLDIGAALTATGASGITLKVGSNKITIGSGGVVIDAQKVKITSDGPATVMGAIVGSK